MTTNTLHSVWISPPARYVRKFTHKRFVMYVHLDIEHSMNAPYCRCLCNDGYGALHMVISAFNRQRPAMCVRLPINSSCNNDYVYRACDTTTASGIAPKCLALHQYIYQRAGTTYTQELTVVILARELFTCVRVP